MKPSTYNSLIKQAGLGRALSRIVSKGINKVTKRKPIANGWIKDWNAYVKHREKLEYIKAIKPPIVPDKKNVIAFDAGYKPRLK